MEALISGLCSWDRHQLSHSQAVLICLCVTCPAENLSYLSCLASLVRKCHQDTRSDCLLPSMFVPAWAHIRTLEVPCDNQSLQLWGAFWLFEWGFIHSLSLITLCTADIHHESLLVSCPILAHSSEQPPCMIHSKAPYSHVPSLLPLQPLCLDPCLLAQFFPGLRRGNFVFIFKSLTGIHSACEGWTHHSLFPCVVLLFCHGALEYWDGKTNWGKGMNDVFLKKLIGKQASVHSFLAPILLSVTYTFPCGACCRGVGEDEAQESSCWSRCFRVSCPLNAGNISLGLRRPWPVVFLAVFYNDKNKQMPIKLVYTSFLLLLSGSGEIEFNSLGIFNEIKFVPKGGSSQNNRDSIYNTEGAVAVDIVVLLKAFIWDVGGWFKSLFSSVQTRTLNCSQTT